MCFMLSAADVNECLTSNGGCSLQATCYNTPGSRTCTCGGCMVGSGVLAGGTGCKYSFTGFFPPIDNKPAINRVKPGSAVPVKFSLGCNAGLNIFRAGYPKWVSNAECLAGSGGAADAVEALTVTPGDSELHYDAASKQYNYVWKTPSTGVKALTCAELQVAFADDGPVYTAMFIWK